MELIFSITSLVISICTFLFSIRKKANSAFIIDWETFNKNTEGVTIFLVKGDVYNFKISSKSVGFLIELFSDGKRRHIPGSSDDVFKFFPYLNENTAVSISANDTILTFEDKYGNKYRQEFFSKDGRTNLGRRKHSNIFHINFNE